MHQRFLILFLFLISPLVGWGQQWAGPDTSTCGQLGVMIGSDDPCPDCCYKWTPATGLSCTDCKNPIATPEEEKTYTVEVLDKYLRSKGDDQVVVKVRFGEMQFTPDFLIQGSDESSVHATLLNLDDVENPSDITWDILDPTLGCDKVPLGLGATLTPGNLYGEIQVEARKTSVPGCYVRKSLPVNNGVREVYAIDLHHPNRKAVSGETLYVISHEDVAINAIPNPGGFKDGIPDWKPDAYGSNMVEDGIAGDVISQPLEEFSDVISEYIAGDSPDFKPKVTVVRMPAQAAEETFITLPAFDLIRDALSPLFKFKDYDEVTDPCGSSAPFEVNFTGPTVKFNEQKVEIYNSPRISKKVEFTLETEITATGRALHPVFSKSFTSKYFGVTLCSRLYIEVATGVGVNVKLVKDPSIPDSSYMFTQPEFTIGMGIGGGAEFAFQVQGYQLTAQAKISSSAKCIFTYENKNILGKLAINPINTKIEAKIQVEGNMGEYEDLSWGIGNYSKELELVSKKEFGPYIMKSF